MGYTIVFCPNPLVDHPLTNKKKWHDFRFGESHSPRKFKKTGCFHGGQILSALSAEEAVFFWENCILH